MRRTLGLLATAVLLVYAHLLCADRLRILGAVPAIPLLLPLLVALHGRPRHALASIAGCVLAIAPFSAEPLPLLPLAYGGIAAAVFALRESVFRSHPLTEALAVALASGLATAAIELTHAVRFGSPSVSVVLERAIVTGALTGALAPVAFRILRVLPTMRATLAPAAR